MSSSSCGYRSVLSPLWAFFLSLLFVAELSFVEELSATTYEYHLAPPIPADCTKRVAGVGNGNGGVLTNLVSKYDSVTYEFSWTATFTKCHNTLPNGYIIVINNGPNPKGHSGELAQVFFDATNPANPALSFYAYNGKTGNEGRASYANSFQGSGAPDRILTSTVGNTSWLKEISVTTGNNTITMHFKIDASIVKNHIPAYPDPNDPWWGIGYDNKIGYWFHPTIGLNTSYCAANDSDSVCKLLVPGQNSTGFLKEVWWKHIGWYDVANRDTNTMPFCVGKYQVTSRDGVPLTNTLVDLDTLPTDGNGCFNISPGEKFYAELTGNDAEHEDLKVTYSGLPNRSAATPLSGTTKKSPVTATFEWSPLISDGGSQSKITYEFMDGYGSTGRCMWKLCVPVDKDPICNLQITSPGANTPQCAGFITEVDFDATGSFDPENGAIDYEWFSTCDKQNGAPEQLNVSTDEKKATLLLTEPGQGRSTSCVVGVRVRDVFGQTVTCQEQIFVQGCPLDCFGQPNGLAQLDQCGVCNGSNACFDCAGIPFGTSTLDQCGVCNGNNACADCFGVPFGTAQLDRCGVCEGDGNSCLDCNSTDITQLQMQLDGQGHEQFQTLRYSTKLLLRKGGRRANRGFVQATRDRGLELRNDNWIATWSIPSNIVACANSPFCVEVSNVSFLQSYDANAEEFATLTKQVIRRMRRQIQRRKGNGRKNRFGSKYLRRANNQLDEAKMLSSSVPQSTSSCS